ncbi:MAG: STAS domain-containing protein [Maritimibacter sp.]|jgi:chemotaxis protein CheX
MSSVRLQLEARLDLRAAEPLAQVLVEHRGNDLILDAREVTQIGALAVQVIRSAAKSWAEDNVKLSMENASTDLSDQLYLLGFKPETITQWEAA